MRSTIAMSFRCVLVLLILLHAGSPQQQDALCSLANQPTECAQEDAVISANYAMKIHNARLERTEQDVDEVQTDVTVRMTACPYQGVPAPRWYKLAVSGEAAAFGRFSQPLRTMEAALCSAGKELIFKSCYPSQLDLPRKYTWISSSQNVSLCFKLTILSDENGAVCEEVETCTNSMAGESGDSESGESGDDDSHMTTAQPSIESGGGSGESHSRSSTEQELDQQTTTLRPTPGIMEVCQERRNCSGAKMRVFCGSDGKVYNSRCEMRYEECIRNLERNSIRIAHVGYCVPTTPPPSSKCESAAEQTHAGWKPKCDCEGLYKVIQCWQNSNVLDCWCSNPNSGSEIIGHRRALQCSDPESFEGLPSCLNLFIT